MVYKCNLHTHTQFCDGKCTMEQMTQNAIAKGFETLGFSPHSLTPFDQSYCMKDYNAFKQEFLRLKQKYKDQINLLMGIEADAFGVNPDDNFDYVIGSVHYLAVNGQYMSVFDVRKNKVFALDESKETFLQLLAEGFDNDIISVAQSYYDTVVDMVQKTKPTIIGHFDLVSLYGDFGEVHEQYEQIAKEAVKRLQGCGCLVEINANRKFKGRGGLYPADFLIKQFLDCGFDFVLSSDAHVVDSLGYDFDNTVAHLKELGVTRLVSFDKNGNRIFVEI